MENDGEIPADKKPSCSHCGGINLPEEMQKKFASDGYTIFKSLLSPEELDKLKGALENDDGVVKHSIQRDDGHGRKIRMCLWNHPGNDITGMLARCEKVAGTMEKLLGGEVYHYHTKLIMKEPHTGGSFAWHQDYGYWYKNGCLFPNMGTVFIAIDKCNKENGCLQVLKGSHQAGRVEHVPVGEQNGADLERVNELKKVLPLVHVELDPGDALFFHCNVLHTSDQNRSDRRRWAFLIAYNRADNNPYFAHHCPQYTPLHKVSDSAIIECSCVTDMSGKDFMGRTDDKSIKLLDEPSNIDHNN